MKRRRQVVLFAWGVGVAACGSDYTGIAGDPLPDRPAPPTGASDAGVEVTPPVPSPSTDGGPACGGHERFDAELGTCACAPGFRKVDADCEWTGVVRDPEFVGVPANAWSIEGGILDPSAGGRIAFDGGLHTLTQASLELPTASELGIGLALRTTDSGYDPQMFFPAPFFVAEGAVSRAVFSRGGCFGERLLGQTLSLQMEGTASPFGGWNLESLDLVPDETCPLPGDPVRNGNFEGTAGWAGLSYDVAAGYGVGGSVGAKVECGGSVSTIVAIPNTEPVALELSGRSPASLAFSVELGETRTIPVSPTMTATHLCVRRALHGLSPQVRVTGSECMGPDETYPIFVDDVRLVPDASCAATPAILDGGFEDPSSPWALATHMTGAKRVEEAGNTVMRLNWSGPYARTEVVSTRIDMPARGTWAVSFRARGILQSASTATVSVRGVQHASRPIGGLSPSTFQPFRMCVPKSEHDSLPRLEFQLNYDGSSAASEVVLDDVALVEDATCTE